MRILFDQGTPVPLRHALTGHTVSTAYELGWAQLANGDLLSASKQLPPDAIRPASLLFRHSGPTFPPPITFVKERAMFITLSRRVVLCLSLVLTFAVAAQNSGPASNGDFEFALEGATGAIQYDARGQGSGSSGQMTFSGAIEISNEDVDVEPDFDHRGLQLVPFRLLRL